MNNTSDKNRETETIGDYENKIIKILEQMFLLESSGHDISHLLRTMYLAKHLQASEGGNIEIITVSALLHDIHRIIQNETGKFCEPNESLPKVKEILDQVGFDKNLYAEVLDAIEHHEEYDFSGVNNAKSIESLIIQDADNLDAIGAIGIARSFAFGGANNVPIYDPSKPLEVGEFTESKLDPSEIHHLKNKLLRLKDNMNTKTAKSMAESRHRFMELYLDEFLNEWDGNR